MLQIVGQDVEKAAGKEGRCEAAVHVMRLDPYTINRYDALHNINITCPPLSQILINTYRALVRLVIAGSGEIVSTEGTTQGDPLTTAMYIWPGDNPTHSTIKNKIS